MSVQVIPHAASVVGDVNPDTGVAKQLDFNGEEVPVEYKTLQKVTMCDELKMAQEKPSLESFKTAIDKIIEATESKFDTVRQCAANTAAGGGGEGSLRRLRDHFRSLKVNPSLLYLYHRLMSLLH